MFRSAQMITSSELIKNFPKISKFMKQYADPVLVSQKGGGYLVLVNVEVYENLLEQKLSKDGTELPQAHLRSYLESKY